MRRIRFSNARDDRGAALAEFALIALPLFAVLLAIIEFGWAFFQLNDVRHGAREGLRLAVVNDDPGSSPPATQGERIAQETCERMDDNAAGATVTLTLGVGSGETSPYEVGDTIRIRVQKNLDQLTGFYGFALDGVVLDEQIESRLEVDPDFVTTSWTCT